MPPRFAAVAMICARRPGAPGRAPRCSSDRYAVAVAVVRPTETPETMRAKMRPPKLGQAMKIAALTTFSRSAGTKTALRPIQSETWPPKNRLRMTPTAYTA